MSTDRPAVRAILGASPGDLRVRPLGIHRLVLPIPFVEAGGTVNAYALEDAEGGLTLFDAGLGTEASRQGLERGLAELGRKIEDVRLIVVSHGHIDHYGAAKFVRERSGARVLVHPADAEKVAGHGARATLLEYAGYLDRLGVPTEAIVGIGEKYKSNSGLAQSLTEVEALAPGQELRLRAFKGTILPMPGHTPGLVCLHVPEHRLVLSADHLLARISPNPLLELGPGGEARKFRSLVTYLESVRRLRELDLEWILPGHGAPFTGHRAIVDSLEAFYDQRQARMLRALAPAPLTPYELIPRVFNRPERLDLFLMMSEIVGNLEALEARGAVARVEGAVPYRYRALAS